VSRDGEALMSMQEFWEYPRGVLVDCPMNGIPDMLSRISYWGKSGWDYQVWDGSIIHVRFNDGTEAVYFAFMNDGVASS
jgi:hypothetical protein